MIVDSNRKTEVEKPFIRMVFALHVRIQGHRAAGVAAGGMYVPPDAALIAAWSACACAGGAPCTCVVDPNFADAKLDYDNAVIADLCAKSITNAGAADMRARRVAFIKAMRNKLNAEFTRAILTACDKAPALRGIKEIKAVQEYEDNLMELLPANIEHFHLWPVFAIISEVFKTLSSPASSSTQSGLSRLYENPDPRRTLNEHIAYIAPAISFLKGLRFANVEALQDHLEAMSYYHFLLACSQAKSSPKAIKDAYLSITRELAAQHVDGDVPPLSTKGFEPYKVKLKSAFSTAGVSPRVTWECIYVIPQYTKLRPMSMM